MAEEGRISLRNLRRAARHELDALEKDGDLSSDELARAEKELDKIIHAQEADIDEALGSQGAGAARPMPDQPPFDPDDDDRVAARRPVRGRAAHQARRGGRGGRAGRGGQAAGHATARSTAIGPRPPTAPAPTCGSRWPTRPTRRSSCGPKVAPVDRPTADDAAPTAIRRRRPGTDGRGRRRHRRGRCPTDRPSEPAEPARRRAHRRGAADRQPGRAPGPRPQAQAGRRPSRSRSRRADVARAPARPDARPTPIRRRRQQPGRAATGAEPGGVRPASACPTSRRRSSPPRTCATRVRPPDEPLLSLPISESTELPALDRAGHRRGAQGAHRRARRRGRGRPLVVVRRPGPTLARPGLGRVGPRRHRRRPPDRRPRGARGRRSAPSTPATGCSDEEFLNFDDLDVPQQDLPTARPAWLLRRSHLHPERAGPPGPAHRARRAPPGAGRHPPRRRAPPPGPTGRPRRHRRRRPPTARRPVPTGSSGGSGRDVPTAALVGVAIATFALILFHLGPKFAVGLVFVVVVLAGAEFFTAVRRGGFRPATLLGLAAIGALPLACYWRGESAIPLVLFLLTAFTALWFILGLGPERHRQHRRHRARRRLHRRVRLVRRAHAEDPRRRA